MDLASGWYDIDSSGTDGVDVDVSANDDSGVSNITCTDGATEVLNVDASSGSFVLGDGELVDLGRARQVDVKPARERVDRDGRGVATVTMDRPAVRNAFNEQLIGDLRAAAETLAGDDTVRVVVLTGAGEVFSAGADLNWMRAMRAYTYEENEADSRELNAMYRELYDLPKPLVGRINGHALGGGTGLTAVCDIAVAAEDALFGFTEVTLGLAPAVISPYVVRKVGRSFARAVFVTGERFGAARALEHGLVHEVVPPGVLDEAVGEAVQRCLRAGPEHYLASGEIIDLPRTGDRRSDIESLTRLLAERFEPAAPTNITSPSANGLATKRAAVRSGRRR